jgi:hypothetical protein
VARLIIDEKEDGEEREGSYAKDLLAVRPPTPSGELGISVIDPADTGDCRTKSVPILS